jgi:hypothetical protein
MGEDPFFIIADDHHEMILLDHPKTFIDQDEQRYPRIDIHLQVFPAARILTDLQPPSFGEKNHIHIQRPSGLWAVNFARDFLRRNLMPPKIQYCGQGSRAALVDFLGMEGNIFDDPSGSGFFAIGESATGKKKRQREGYESGAPDPQKAPRY